MRNREGGGDEVGGILEEGEGLRISDSSLSRLQLSWAILMVLERKELENFSKWSCDFEKLDGIQRWKLEFQAESLKKYWWKDEKGKVRWRTESKTLRDKESKGLKLLKKKNKKL